MDMIEITAENIKNYTLDDVIFPIIGHKVKMPSNPDMCALIEELMAKDDMSMAKFNAQSALVSTSATGSYRKIVARAEDVTCDIVEVCNPNEDLLTPNYLSEPDPTPTAVDENSGSVSKALRIKFSLKPSSYATMFLREVARTSSAFNEQYQIS
jgi:tRNA(Glu) U13 pseudouridine synthase TruD